MVNYIVWHVVRDGSNMLMSMLHQTGLAGVTNFERCGFHVGFQTMNEVDFKKRSLDYLEMQRTPNGISGCKAGFSYAQNIKKFTKNPNLVRWWIDQFDVHFLLRRRDMVAQSVSTFFAGHTKQWHSNSPVQNVKIPEYSFDEIAQIHANIEGQIYERNQYFRFIQLRCFMLEYEAIVENPSNYFKYILARLEIPWNKNAPLPQIEKQSDPVKDAYIARFKNEVKEKSK